MLENPVSRLPLKLVRGHGRPCRRWTLCIFICLFLFGDILVLGTILVIFSLLQNVNSHQSPRVRVLLLYIPEYKLE